MCGRLRKFNAAYTRESILCPVADPDVADYAKEHGITRALAAVELHREYFRDCIFLCGNAPLALAGVIKLYAEHGIEPALIVGMPVGFVNVVESKKLLDEVKVPWIRLTILVSQVSEYSFIKSRTISSVPSEGENKSQSNL